VAQRRRPTISVTLAADLIERLEAEAKVSNVSISQLIEAYVREHYQGNVVQQLQHLESAFNEFKASVVPVVNKVAGLIQQFEQDGVLRGQGAAGPPPKIATYEEMYGPIGPDDARATSPAPPRDEPKGSWWGR
jgi:hypothetical protein